MIVEIHLTYFTKPLPKEKFNKLIEELPPIMAGINAKYVRWQERHAHLFGKLLLQNALKDNNLKYDLKKLKTTEFNRPYLNTNYDFNISHSGSYVMCAFTIGHKLGIDVEHIQQINLDDFNLYFSNNQIYQIRTSDDPMKSFYKLWVIKESMMKADGRGINLPIDQLEVKNNTINFENAIWQLTEIPTRSEYCAALCTDSKISQIKFVTLDFYNDLTCPKTF